MGSLLEDDRVLCHPLIRIELACGTPPPPRQRTLNDLGALQQATVATTDEILSLIEAERLHDSGCGAVDVALLASALLTPRAVLWTMDRHLGAQAKRLGVAFVRGSGPPALTGPASQPESPPDEPPESPPVPAPPPDVSPPGSLPPSVATSLPCCVTVNTFPTTEIVPVRTAASAFACAT